MLSSHFNDIYRIETREEAVDFVDRLVADYPDFQAFFGDGRQTLSEEQLGEIRNKFAEMYPNYNLDDLYEKYKAVPVPDPCNVNVYDPQTKKFYNPNITTSTKRTKPIDFNLADFLIKEQENHRCYNIHFENDPEELFDLHDLPFEEKKKSNSATESSLHQIAKLTLILNDLKEMLPFQMLAVRGEEIIL